jgi:hypothetical protein
VAQSLADLQDPSKFTLGQAEQRKRINKASFSQKGTLDTQATDPADPLSSLDPLWTIKKTDKADK